MTPNRLNLNSTGTHVINLARMVLFSLSYCQFTWHPMRWSQYNKGEFSDFGQHLFRAGNPISIISDL